MWPFRRRSRAEPAGSIRLGEHSPHDDDYPVFTVSESRHPAAFESLWRAASDTERDSRSVRRWATLVPVRDPRFGVADLVVHLDGQPACYVRPPALDLLVHRIDAERVATLEVPALVEWGPVGPTVRLRVPPAA